ncbi:oxidoreductase [Thermococcus chitonophagus]|nr:SDR family NAD(P)-dependent oxidoreductase [Thermococcus chitonophagus]ASJ17571.1 oxidoreductase [Thermococcus chitonophagus]
MKVLITGSSSGIGLELSKIFLSKGYRVYGVSRREVNLGDNYTHIKADLSIRKGIEIVKKFLGNEKLDILVNNAGFGILKPILEHSWEEMEEIFRLNVISPIILTRELLSKLKLDAKVVFVISGAAFVKIIDMPVYGASKSALHYLTVILEDELKPRRVIRVYPKQVKTPFWNGKAPAGSLDPREVAEKIVSAIEKGKREVFIPWYIGLSKPFGMKYRFRFR